MRRELGAGCLAFIVGLLITAGGITYLYARFVIPEQGWQGVVDCIVRVLEFSLLGGLAVALAVVIPLNRWHHFRGFYRCNYCGRALKRGKPCECRSGPP